MQVKRWFAAIFSGVLLAGLGILILLDLRPILSIMEWVKTFAQAVPSELVAWCFVVLGALIFFIGWKNANYSILDIHESRDKNALIDSLYRRRKLNYGPKIVAIGGGTGLSTLLRGIKKITNNITAIVTVGDDGGSSGRLRQEMGVLPPGDIRNCIAALADDDDLVTKLFQYRFKTGEGLEGHSFGNLFLTALCSITGDMVNAVKESSKVLSIRGHVLPSTLDDMRLAAELEDGTIVNGESMIPEVPGKIKRLFTIPENCKPLDEAINAIKNADLIILGPGSLYTSVIPNLLIKEISQEIANSNAKKIYICNIMTQPGETDEYSAADHLKALIEHAGSNKIVETVLVNDSLPKTLAEKYFAANSYPVKVDEDEIKKLGVNIVSRKLIEDSKEGFVRHSSNRLSRAIYYWYRKNNKDSKRKADK
ncbi:YvcK family protein [bacterium]|nr:YvcK family protein [bacterium]